MISIKKESTYLSKNVTKAIENLKKLNFDKAKELISYAMEENYNLGKPHELLGIYYELNGDVNLAMKHYRAALALEPNLISAIKNLERICEFRYICSREYIDFGE